MYVLILTRCHIIDIIFLVIGAHKMKILKYEKKANNQYKIYLENNETINVYEDVILKHKLLYKKEP